MKNKVDIVLDCDGILLNYIDCFVEWVEKYKGWTLNRDHPHDTYNMAPWFLPKNGKEMTSEEFMELIKEYNLYPRIISPVEGSVEAVKRLKQAGYTMVVLTSFGGSVGSVDFRKYQLNKLFPDCFDDIIVLGLGGCKKEQLQKLKPKYFVDDYDKYLEDGLSLDIYSIGLNTSYNGNTEAIYVDTWNEVNYIIGEKENLKEVV